MYRKYLLYLFIFLFVTGCDNKNNPTEVIIETKPIIKLLSPTTTTEILDSVLVEIDATDDKGIIKVEFYLNNVVIKTFTLPPYKFNWDVTNLNDSSSHLIYAKAYDADDNVTSSEVITVNIKRLLRPTNLTATLVSNNSVQLNWIDNSKWESGYVIERADGIFGNLFIEIVQLPANSVSYIDENLMGSEYYNYRVKAIKENKSSLFSNSIIVFIPTTNPINLFPLIPGRIIQYNSGNLLYLDSDSSIAGTSTGFQSKWIIAGKVAPGPSPFNQPTIIIDTTIVAGQTIGRTFLVHHDSINNELWFLINLGYLFRSQQINDANGNVRGDSLRWILLAKHNVGVGVDWIAFNETFTSNFVGPIRLEIKGNFEAIEYIVAGGSTYETNRFVLTRRIYLGSSTTSISTGIMSRFWFANNIGPIKIELRGDAESNGKVQTMTGKNF